MAYKINGVAFDITQPRRIGDYNYAAGALLTVQDQWPSLGITAEVDPIPTAEEVAAAHIAAQTAKWEEIKTFRDYLILNGVHLVPNGKWIHTDTFSRTQWMAMVMMGASLPAIQWKTMDGTFITTTPALAGEVFQSVAVADATLFGVAEYHRAQMMAAVDPAAYDFSAGWPATYV